jgi:predicted amidohydrolase YtcJ
VIADSALPDLDALASIIEQCHRSGRPVAAHGVSVDALVLLVAALDDVGSVAGDRVEDAAVVPNEYIAKLSDLRVRVIMQPGFLAVRGARTLCSTLGRSSLPRRSGEVAWT